MPEELSITIGDTATSVDLDQISIDESGRIVIADPKLVDLIRRARPGLPKGPGGEAAVNIICGYGCGGATELPELATKTLTAAARAVSRRG